LGEIGSSFEHLFFDAEDKLIDATASRDADEARQAAWGSPALDV
jgi:hypothetical protein